jgi:hypothetical protein
VFCEIQNYGAVSVARIEDIFTYALLVPINTLFFIDLKVLGVAQNRLLYAR